MPRPPILPTIDWEPVFNGGKTAAEWLDAAENPELGEKMRADADAFSIGFVAKAALEALPRPVHVIAIAEDWCGDVVRHAPVLIACEKAAPETVRVRFIAREDNPELFARFLTNGGEAIPKFVFLSADWVEAGNWGPMPENGRRLIARGKAAGDVGAARQKVNKLYEADPERREVVSELLVLFDIASCEAP